MWKPLFHIFLGVDLLFLVAAWSSTNYTIMGRSRCLFSLLLLNVTVIIHQATPWLMTSFIQYYVFGRWAATPWWSGTLCSLSTPSPSSLHDYHGNSCWQAMGPDPYYPELLPTKPRPIPMPHNTLSSWRHPGYKKLGCHFSSATSPALLFGDGEPRPRARSQ
jgi:hypothetical protein